MKNLKDILERKDDSICTLPKWADFIKIDLNMDEIEYFTVAELSDNDIDSKLKKLKVGESYFDEKDQTIYVCLIDLEALNEK